MRLLLDLLALIRALAADRARLALENLVLRQQLTVLRRSVKRTKLDDSDRIFWVLIRCLRHPATLGCNVRRPNRPHLPLPRIAEGNRKILEMRGGRAAR